LSEIIQLQKIKKTLTKRRQQHTLLDECSLSVNQGDMLAITGQSGIGKSTLLNIIGCLDFPTQGKYLFDDHDVTKMNIKQRNMLRKKHFGYIFQQYLLIEHLSVLDNVALALQYRNPRQNSCSESKKILNEFGLSNHENHKPNELSGGQQQRASLARAIITNPRVLLADEPTGALDAHNSHLMMKTLKEINQSRDTTIILVTHDLEMANYCKRTITMESILGKAVAHE